MSRDTILSKKKKKRENKNFLFAECSGEISDFGVKQIWV